MNPHVAGAAAVFLHGTPNSEKPTVFLVFLQLCII